MLRRKPSRVEERADVADEYEFYLREKESKQQAQRDADGHGEAPTPTADAEHAARQRRETMRSRIGLNG